MFINRKCILGFVILQTIIGISYETPTEAAKEVPEEVYESEIENLKAKKGEENAKNEKLNETNIQEIKNKTSEGITSQKIDQLEKEKGELYKKISQAIDESVLLLEHTNNTQAQLGINFMKNLREQLKEINGSDIAIELDDKEGSVRRRSRAKDAREHEKKILITYQEIAEIFKEKNRNGTKVLKGSDIAMENKIDNWILQRQLERKRILELKGRLKVGKKEKCPRFGISKKKIKVKGVRRGRYLPCCRKCCKKSYLGCL